MDQQIIKQLAYALNEAQKITVFTGAGISTNCGIPDFRGPEGIYKIVKQKYQLPYPEAIFDINYFLQNPQIFYDFSKELHIDETEPSLTHHFITYLEEKSKICQIITQNIDMLHQKSGSKKVLECHGTFARAHCVICKKKYSLSEIEHNLINGTIKYCDCGGLVKPDIVFFGESLPDEFYHIYRNPLPTDLLLVLGSSLSVFPAADLVLKLLNTKIPSILINFEATQFDALFTYVIHEELDQTTQLIWDQLKNRAK